MRFEIQPEERKRIAAWLEEHNKTCPLHNHDGDHNPMGAIGGSLTYQFTHTGLGLITSVLCGCGEQFNATNFDDW